MISKARLLLSPCCLCFILSATHFYYNQQHIYGALCLLCLLSMLIKHPVFLRLNQAAMLLLCAEWLHHLLAFISNSKHPGDTWLQMALLLGVIGLLHLISALLFQHHRIRHYFGYPRLYIFR